MEHLHELHFDTRNIYKIHYNFIHFIYRNLSFYNSEAQYIRTAASHKSKSAWAIEVLSFLRSSNGFHNLKILQR